MSDKIQLYVNDQLVYNQGAGPTPPIPPDPPIPPIPPIPPDVTVIAASYDAGQAQRYLTQAYGAFVCNPFAVQFTVPLDAQPSTRPGRLSVAELAPSPTAIRQVTLSETPGQFSGPGILARQEGVQCTIDISVGPGAVALTPGKTYFFNIRNYSSDAGACSCNVANCGASIDTIWPA